MFLFHLLFCFSLTSQMKLIINLPKIMKYNKYSIILLLVSQFFINTKYYWHQFINKHTYIYI